MNLKEFSQHKHFTDAVNVFLQSEAGQALLAAFDHEAEAVEHNAAKHSEAWQAGQLATLAKMRLFFSRSAHYTQPPKAKASGRTAEEPPAHSSDLPNS